MTVPRFGLIALIIWLPAGLGCRPAEAPPAAAPAMSGEPPPTPAPAEAQLVSVNWAAAEDCRAKLALLRDSLRERRIERVEDAPFSLLVDDPTLGRRDWRGLGVSAAGGAAVDARCVIRLGRATERRSDRRDLGGEHVRSSYQSGSRMEKNPAYDVAKAKLRKAEKAAKPGKSPIIKVGDPLLDLVGLLVGGAITGVSQWGAGDQLDEALDELMATPASIERPEYRDYQFERKRVRVAREATTPITLTDRWLRRSWRTALRRRETREILVLDGLDRRDGRYAEHMQNAMTESGLRQWLDEAPAPDLEEIVDGLLERSSGVPPDRLALVGAQKELADAGPLAGDDGMDAAVLPITRKPLAPRSSEGASPLGRSSGGAFDEAIASLVEVLGDGGSGRGVYVARHFVLAPSELVSERGLVDVEDRRGRRALGLAAAVDRGLGLALIQAPHPGRPIEIANAEAVRPKPSSSEDEESGPIIADGRLLGFKTAAGPRVSIAAIEAFLDDQRRLLTATSTSF